MFLHRFYLFLSFCTVGLLCAGALVTSTGSGLAVPDWPLSYGTLMPEMVGGIFYEHGHRLIAGGVAILTVIQVFLCLRWESRPWVRGVSIAALVAVLLQAALGGLTVILRLPPAVSILHACLAQIYFCLVVTLIVTTSRAWSAPSGLQADLSFTPLANISVALVVLFFLQLIAGATVRHMGAGLAIPDFPRAYGQWVPPFHSFSIVIHFAHRVGALLIFVTTGTLALYTYRRFSQRFDLLFWIGLLTGLVFFQVGLGASIIWMRKPVPITMLHLATGALCLGSSLGLCLMANRLRWLYGRGSAPVRGFAPSWVTS